MSSTLQRAAWITAAVYISIGVAGFVPGLTTADNLALGLFKVNNLHNFLHLITGIVAAFAAASSPHSSRQFFQLTAWLYSFLLVISLIQKTSVLGLIPVNLEDTLLHIVTLVSAFLLGYGVRDRIVAQF